MKTVFKVVGGVLAAVAAIIALNVLASLLVYAAWNWGLVGAVTFARPVGLVQAFFLSLLASSTMVYQSRD